MASWSIDQATATYSLKHWNGGYFKIRKDGHVVMSVVEGAEVDLAGLPTELAKQGLGLPVLVRFMDILDARLDCLCNAFYQAREALDYVAPYTAIYPIKVNQQRTVVERLVRHGGELIGLESGSKPELLAVLAQSRPGGLVICNGYKDREYVRMALIGQMLGLAVHIVIEKPSELDVILQEAEDLQVRPMLGLRVRLSTIGAGKWQNTGGEKAKFGLSAAQVLTLCRRLSDAGMLDCLQLLHFHMGSQISRLDDIRLGLKEATRYFAELHRLGAPIGIVDVGGGLGIDYEGSRSQSFCSVDYGLEDYAWAVVEALATICAETGLAQPQILTEAGRAMTAHHAVLITNVIDTERVPVAEPRAETGVDDPCFQALRRLLHETGTSFQERYEATREALLKIHQDYSEGLIGLEARAEGERLYFAICRDIAAGLDSLGGESELRDEIQTRLADKLFCNFSVFQSVPDVWAFNQIFPVMPLLRLDEPPTRRAVIQDLTCDSDGHIEYYVDAKGVERTLPVHEIEAGEPYPIGIFLVGAYQEILGDLHNLFGDTHAINVVCTEEGYHLVDPEPGDRVDELLRYVHYDTDVMKSALERLMQGLDPGVHSRVISELADGLSGYTYHED